MSKQRCFRDAEDRLKEISAKGDPLETLAGAVDFKRFKPILEEAAGRPRSPKGGCPSFDPVLKFKMSALQSLRGLSLEATENMVRDRPGWMRFCGLEMCDRVPDANTLRDFHEVPVKAGAFDDLFKELDQAADEAGCIPRSGRIVDASLVAAPRQRNTNGEKAAIKDGRSAGEIRPDSPAKASQKDTDARWMVKYGKGKPGPDGKKRLDIAIPVFGCKTRIRIDSKYGIIRSGIAASASANDGARLREGLVRRNIASGDARGDTDCRSAENEKWLKGKGLRSRIHRKKPNGRPMSARTAKSNGRKSTVRSKVEHVFAHQKARMGLAIRTIGFDRAEATAALANMACSMGRLRWLLSQGKPA